MEPEQKKEQDTVVMAPVPSTDDTQVMGVAATPVADRYYPTGEEILASNDRDVIELHVPQWGGWIPFRALTGAEAIKFQALATDPEKQKEAWIQIVGMCAVKKSNPDSRLFTDEQVSKLRDKSAAVFISVQKELSKLNGFRQDAVEESKNA